MENVVDAMGQEHLKPKAVKDEHTVVYSQEGTCLVDKLALET